MLVVWVVFAFTFPTTDDGPLAENIQREREVTIKRIARPVVIFERRVAVPLGPKRVWVLNPPRADKSAFLPDWSKTVIISKIQIITCKTISRLNKSFLLYLSMPLSHF